MMTRSERRALWRKAEKDPRAINCPDCGKKTFAGAMLTDLISIESNGQIWKSPFRNTRDLIPPGDHFHILCVVCGHYFGTAKADEVKLNEYGLVDMSDWNKPDATERVRAAIQSLMDTPIEEFEEVAYGEKSNGDAVEVPSVADALQSGMQAE